MVTPPESGDSFVLDANVLIDYCQSDRTVLSLIPRYVGFDGFHLSRFPKDFERARRIIVRSVRI